jgi:PAS domain S-box-containing protein/diguanylate cyclase (GGDEF)-like protein
MHTLKAKGGRGRLAFYEALVENAFDAVCFVDHDRRITFWNKEAEALTGYTPGQLVGKSCCEDLLLHFDEDDETVTSGSWPVAETLRDGKLREADVYLRHRSGRMAPVRMRCAPIHDDDGRIIGAIEVLRDVSELEEVRARLRAIDLESYTDPVTGLDSRTHTEHRIQGRLDEMRRYGWRFGVVMAHVDNWDDLAECHSDETLEQIIRLSAHCFAGSLRSFDTVGRWSHHEFIALAPILRDQDLYAIGERVRDLVEQAVLQTSDRLLGATISVGATVIDERDNVDTLVERAQLCTVESRQSGGNRVTL